MPETETAYERACKARCEWCAKEWPRDSSWVHSGYEDGERGSYTGVGVFRFHRCTAPTLLQYIEELAAHLADRQRLFDLVRFCRHKLHEEDLISDEEFSRILADGSADTPGGGSVKRLESYDEMRAQFAEAKRDTERLDDLDGLKLLCQHDCDGHSIGCIEERAGYLFRLEHSDETGLTWRRLTWRAAIDAAREGKKP